MVEVFKTNITHPLHAALLVQRIQKQFTAYSANFDLQDCDNILRIQSNTGNVQASALISFLREWGCVAEIFFMMGSNARGNIILKKKVISTNSKNHEIFFIF